MTEIEREYSIKLLISDETFDTLKKTNRFNAYENKVQSSNLNGYQPFGSDVISSHMPTFRCISSQAGVNYQWKQATFQKNKIIEKNNHLLPVLFSVAYERMATYDEIKEYRHLVSKALSPLDFHFIKFKSVCRFSRTENIQGNTLRIAIERHLQKDDTVDNYFTIEYEGAGVKFKHFKSIITSTDVPDFLNNVNIDERWVDFLHIHCTNRPFKLYTKPEQNCFFAPKLDGIKATAIYNNGNLCAASTDFTFSTKLTLPTKSILVVTVECFPDGNMLITDILGLITQSQNQKTIMTKNYEPNGIRWRDNQIKLHETAICYKLSILDAISIMQMPGIAQYCNKFKFSLNVPTNIPCEFPTDGILVFTESSIQKMKSTHTVELKLNIYKYLNHILNEMTTRATRVEVPKLLFSENFPKNKIDYTQFLYSQDDVKLNGIEYLLLPSIQEVACRGYLVDMCPIIEFGIVDGKSLAFIRVRTDKYVADKSEKIQNHLELGGAVKQYVPIDI